MRQRKGLLVVTLGLAAAVAWLPALHSEGHLRPVERWGYFLAGQSGPVPGRSIPPMAMVDVTGKWKGRSHCYTCDWVAEPTVVAFVKPGAREAESLVREIDAHVRADHGRGGNLQGCVVFLGGKELVPKLESLAQREGTKIPLLYLPPRRAPFYLQLSPLVDSTVLFSEGHVVVRGITNATADGTASGVAALLTGLRRPKMARDLAAGPAGAAASAAP